MKIRREKEITICWKVKTNGQDLPLTKDCLALELARPDKAVTVLDFDINGNTVTAVLPASGNTMCGNYILTLYSHRNAAQATALDSAAFELVARSYLEESGNTDSLDAEVVNLEGDITVGYTAEQIIELIKGYAGDKSNLATEAKSTLVSAINEIYNEFFINVDGGETVFDENRNGRQYRKVTVDYAMAANVWKSICLPFNLSNEELVALFGEDYKLGTYNSFTVEYDEKGAKPKLGSIVRVYELVAGKPYVIYPTKNVEKIVVYDKEITANTTITELTNSGYKCSFNGDYVIKHIAPSQLARYFAISNGVWSEPIGEIPLKGYRIYIKFEATNNE